MLSPNSSFNSTNVPPLIFSASLFGIGRAGDRTNACGFSTVEVGIGVFRRADSECILPSCSVSSGPVCTGGAIATDWMLAAGGRLPNTVVPAGEQDGA